MSILPCELVDPGMFLPDGYSDDKSETDEKVTVVSHLLVFINPVSGSGKGEQVYWRKIQPLFKRNGINAKVIVTKYQNESGNYLEINSLDRFDGIVIVGGDGSIAEALHGLHSNSKYQKLTLPIGTISTGSGCGLAKSLLYASNHLYTVLESAKLIVEGKKLSMDLMNVEFPSQRRLAFLTVSWGVMSRIDKNSERFRRWLGSWRFEAQSLIEIRENRHYPGTLYYLPKEDKDSCELPKLHTPLSNRFKKVEGPFSMVLACKTSHLASNVHSAPGSKLDDGVITLIYVLALSKFEVIKVLWGLEDGSYLKCSEKVVRVRTRAFRIVPGRTTDILMVDGEKVPYEAPFTRVQASVIPKSFSVYCNPTPSDSRN